MANQCITNHSAFVYDRGGKRRIGPVINISLVRWSRHRDNTSDAMVRVEGSNCDENAAILNEIRTHRHELVIFRGNERAWEGPLHRIATGPGWAELHARDVSEYLFAQPMTQAYENSTLPDGTVRSTTVTGRIENIIEYEMSHGRIMTIPASSVTLAEISAWTAAGGTATAIGDQWMITVPSFESNTIWPGTNILPHLDVRHFPNEARTGMDTFAFETTVGLHLQSLVRRSGIDFTVLGRSIIIWDVSRHIGILPTMTEASFSEEVITTEYGADHAQAAYSVGQNGMYGQALNLDNLAYYGPWTDMHTVYNEDGSAEPSQNQLNSQASRNLAGRSPAPIEVRVPDNSTIYLSPEIGINALVPGVQVPLRATLNYRQLAQQQKIDAVVVEESGDSGETVSVTLTPATKPDSDEE